MQTLCISWLNGGSCVQTLCILWLNGVRGVQAVSFVAEWSELCAGTVRIYLRSWLKARDTTMVQRLKEERAVIHYNHNLLTSALRQWQLHRSTALRKQVGAVLCNSVPCCTMQTGWLQYFIIQYNAKKLAAVFYNSVQYCTVQTGWLQCFINQYDAEQCRQVGCSIL